MADLYSLVKKQDEKIDDLLKTAKENKDLLTDIDTRLVSGPVQTEPSASAIPERIQVELPSNIATKENVYGAVNQALKNQTDYTAQAITKVCSGFMFKSPSPSPSAPAVSDEQIRKIAQEAADKAVDKRYENLMRPLILYYIVFTTLSTVLSGRQSRNGCISFSQSQFSPPEASVMASSTSLTKTPS